MDLALKDIRRHLGKFIATIAGVAMLLSIVLVMNGIYQGNIADGVWLIEYRHRPVGGRARARRSV